MPDKDKLTKTFCFINQQWWCNILLVFYSRIIVNDFFCHPSVTKSFEPVDIFISTCSKNQIFQKPFPLFSLKKIIFPFFLFKNHFSFVSLKNNFSFVSLIKICFPFFPCKIYMIFPIQYQKSGRFLVSILPKWTNQTISIQMHGIKSISMWETFFSTVFHIFLLVVFKHCTKEF